MKKSYQEKVTKQTKYKISFRDKLKEELKGFTAKSFLLKLQLL